MDTQTYDASRLFTTKVGAICSEDACPRCSCPLGKIAGDKWFHESQNPFMADINRGSVRCGECECKDDGDGILYAHCEYVSEYYIGLSSCPESNVTTNTISCHRQFESYGVTMAVTNLSTRTCESSTYCKSSFNPIDNYTSWRCTYNDGSGNIINDWYCEAYTNDECVHIQTTISYDLCDGNIIENTVDYYKKCCNADNNPNCNHESIDLSSCKQMDDPELKYRECWYSSDAWKQYVCDDHITEISCDAVKAVFLEHARCKCKYSWSPMYNGLHQSASEYGKYVAGEINNDYLKWFETVGCNINFACNITSGTIIGIDADTSTTLQPTYKPTFDPSSEPSNEPSEGPFIFTTTTTLQSTDEPTFIPTTEPSTEPSTTTTTTIDIRTSAMETYEPSIQPVMRTISPSTDPTVSPTLSRLSQQPSESPLITTAYQTSMNPSEVPTSATITTDLTSTTVATHHTSMNPTEESTESPSIMTTYSSSINPSETPSTLIALTDTPSSEPSNEPSTTSTTVADITTTIVETYEPSIQPVDKESSESPTTMTTRSPSMNPSESPSAMIAITDTPSDCDEDKKNGNKGSGKNKDKKGYSALSNKLIADHWKEEVDDDKDGEAFEHSLMLNLVVLIFSIILLMLILFVWCKQRESWMVNDKNVV